MTRARLPLIAMCSILPLMIISCAKKSTTSTATPTSKLNSLFADFRDTSQIFSITAGTTQSVTGADGTILNFYPTSFKDVNGNIITNGPIKIQLVEMYSLGDMVKNRATTTAADGHLLQSGGEVNITATWNGQPVTANNYGIYFKQPEASGIPMQVFTGTYNTTDSLPAWSASDTSRRGNYASGTSQRPGLADYYLFDSCRNLGWTNCDRFFDSLNKTAVSVVMPDNSYDQTNTEIFLVFPDINAVVDVSGNSNQYTASTNTFKLTHGQAPVGMNFKLVIIANKNGGYFFYETAGTVKDNLSIPALMASQSKANIMTLLSAL